MGVLAKDKRRARRARYVSLRFSEYVTIPKRLHAPHNLVASGYIEGISPSRERPK